MKWIQKITINGSSAIVTVPRELLFRLKTRPGDFVELEHKDDEDGYTVRLWKNREHGNHNRLGKITDPPEALR